MEISHCELIEIVSYEEETGIFRSLVDRKSSNGAGRVVRKGDVLGGLSPKGYVQLTINGRCYGAHRLAWLYVYGHFPNGQIDHVDGNRSNNRISNLRECSNAQNMQNIKKYKADAHSKHLGVSYDKRSDKWIAYVNINGRMISRLCKTEAEAVCRRRELKAKHHAFNPLDREAA